MKNTIVLEMLNNGEIEQLKALLTEEIYRDSLKNNGEAKSRCVAMKRFFKYVGDNREMFAKPCISVKVHGEFYNSFLEPCCFALTTDNVNNMEVFNSAENKYIDVQKIVNYQHYADMENIDLSLVLTNGKSKGYKFKKSEFDAKSFQYLFKYKDAYFKFGLFDKAFSIINDGKKAEVYYNGSKSILFIKTSVGIAGICPMCLKDGVEGKIVVCVDNNIV